MSYVERAFYWYLKQMLTSGIKTLFSRKFLPYSLFFLSIVTATSLASAVAIKGIMDVQFFLDLLLEIEVSLGVGFVITGLFFGKQRADLQFLLILIIASITWAYLHFVNSMPSEYIATISYLLWIAFTVLASYFMFRDIFAGTFTGTIMFLGKPKNQGSILFAGPISLVLLGDVALSYLLVDKGINTHSFAPLLTGLVYGFTALFAFIIIITFAGSDDVFFTGLMFYLAFGTIRLGLYVWDVISDKTGIVSYTDTFMVLFFLIYTVSGFSKKAAKIKVQVEGLEDNLAVDSKKEKKKQKSDAPQWLGSRFARLIGDKGAILIILGLIFGFHVTQISVLMQKETPFNQVFFMKNMTDIGLLGHFLSSILTPIIFFFILFYYVLSPSFRKYTSPELNRFSWLPPFEDLIILIEQTSKGNINLVKELGKFGTAAVASKIISPFKRGEKESFSQKTEKFFSRLVKQAKEKKTDKEDKS